MKPCSGTAWRMAGYWGCWFRVFGYGLCVTNMEPLFSERFGYTKTLRIFGVKFKLLQPDVSKN